MIRPGPYESVRFAGTVALLGILSDAAIGHGLTWENDPYWTYWVTKSFLIFTVFGLGTAWMGVGEGRGAVITAVHTLVLTVYYWTFSPIGLPSIPVWLDLEHTWISGLPIHFGVIYLGYLAALWIWRRRWAGIAVPGRPPTRTEERGPAWFGTASLVVGAVIVLVAGGAASLALQEFPGVTWFVVRALITVPILFWWWSGVGRDVAAAVAGGILLAVVWAAYGQFVGPSGLPDAPLRVLDPAPPPATVRWLDYRELWLISFPIYAAAMVGILLAFSRWVWGPQELRRALPAAALVPLILLITGATIDEEDLGVRASFSAEGPVRVEGGTGAVGRGVIRIDTTDMGNRVTPLPPHDRLVVDAHVSADGHTYRISVDRPLVEDPTGTETTWWGVAYGVDYREGGGVFTTDLVAHGLGSVELDGGRVIAPVPVEIVAAPGYGLELAIGADALPLEDLPALSFEWGSYSGSAPHGVETARYVGGGLVLLLLLVSAFLLARGHAPPQEM
ncbi:MAG TPA: hypothetical protein VNO79_01215 [Actinomycetota bacterium]|nr:hypothetical protein [Actinomycetota bacterium]